MKIIFFVLLSVFVLSGCGSEEQTKAKFTGYSKICIEGVYYLQFPSGVSVMYGTNYPINVQRCAD